MSKSLVTTKTLYNNLDKLFTSSPTIKLEDKDRWVIFSDLHMGDGSSTDDFKRNALLFQGAINDYYSLFGYNLVLNGDVEELLRFSLKKIYKQWSLVYGLFDQFYKEGKLFKIIGNHDIQLPLIKDRPFDYDIYDGIKLEYQGDHIFIFHGHQASKKYQEHSELIGFTLKYFVDPIGIKSYSVSHSSRKQYKIEKKVYGYSSFNKIASVIGHTHRPLFESLHKEERLKFKIEQLCRELSNANNGHSTDIRESIKTLKKQLKKYHRLESNSSAQNIYNSLFHIPCLFNSGCAIGKRGMTCLEIEGGKIRLVHWFDKNISKKFLANTGYEPEKIGNTNFYRMVLNEESLDYIFTRIKLLS